MSSASPSPDPAGSPGRSHAGPSETYNSYGYGGGYPDAGPQRGLSDYLVIVRERFWIILVVLIPVVAFAVVYTLRQTKLYTAEATLEILRSAPAVIPVREVSDTDIRSAEDLNTQVRALRSQPVFQRVAERIQGEDLRRFMAPYQTGAASDPVNPGALLPFNYHVLPQRSTLVIALQYEHPDPEIAARVANLFVDEYIAYRARLRSDDATRALADLKKNAGEQQVKVEELERRLQSYKEQNSMVSLDQRKDIITDTLKQQNALVTQAESRVAETEIVWNLVQQYRQEGRALTDIAHIAQQSLISSLQQQIASHNIDLAQLGQRYRAKHPRMIDAMKRLEQSESELALAVRATCAKIETDFLTARRGLDEARATRSLQEAEVFKLDRLSVDYGALARQLEVEEQIFQTILGRMREISTSSTIEAPSARVMNRAGPPNAPSSPNLQLNLVFGVVVGLGLGGAVAFLVALLDDRVKSAYDIEGFVGLPLLGIVPAVRKLDPVTRAHLAVNSEDHRATEAFRSLHSTLKLDVESRHARVVLVTSTVPSEGKSFVASNLALTFAAQGERVLLIDTDLRKPSLHRFYNVDRHKGVVELVNTPGATLASLVHVGVMPNLDLLATGGRAKNPAQILGSPDFARILGEARQRYDRVILDTPPLGAVSDALTLVPLADGSIYVLQFNRARRKTAQVAVRRLLASTTPVFGAVLNGLNLKAAGYYYAGLYDKSYEDYYIGAEQPRIAGKV